MEYTIKKNIWYILEKLDSIINHKIIDNLMDFFPMENKDGSNSIYYKIWKNTFRRICNFIVVDLYGYWFPNGIE